MLAASRSLPLTHSLLPSPLRQGLLAPSHARPRAEQIYNGFLDVGLPPNGVGVQYMHYWMVESQRDPANDPVLIWCDTDIRECILYLYFFCEPGVPQRGPLHGITQRSVPFRLQCATCACSVQLAHAVCALPVGITHIPNLRAPRHRYNGGPGASSLFGMLVELGPLLLNEDSLGSAAVNGTPAFQANPFGWSSVATVVALDNPPPVGFSYVREHACAFSVWAAHWTYTLPV